MAIDTRQNIIRRAQKIVNNTSTILANEMKEWINVRYDRITYLVTPQMLQRQKNKSPIASTRELSLGTDVLRILSVYDTSNSVDLEETTLETIEKDGLDTTNDTGNPLFYAELGEFFVDRSLSAADTINVVSSSSADVSPQVVRITGEVSGVEVSEDITLTGTSAATGSLTFDSGQRLTVSTGTSNNTERSIAGTITVTETTAGTTIAVIPASQVAILYKWVTFKPIPDTSSPQPVHRITYVKRPLRFNADNDVPMYDCTDGLVFGLVADALSEDGNEQDSAIYEGKFNAIISEMIANRNKRPNYIEQFAGPAVGRGGVRPEARIGGVYTNPWSR